jgi:hypothetical protein
MNISPLKTIDNSNYSNINNPKARAKVLEFMKIYNLADVFREIYPELKRFSWRQNNPLKHASLSMFLPSSSRIFDY